MAISTGAGRVAVVKAIDGYALTDAEFAFTIDSQHEEYKHDDRTLWSLASDLNIGPGKFNDWVEEVSAEAWLILSIPGVWDALMTLAKELKRDRTLTGDRVRQVLDEAVSYCPEDLASLATDRLQRRDAGRNTTLCDLAIVTLHEEVGRRYLRWRVHRCLPDDCAWGAISSLYRDFCDWHGTEFAFAPSQFKAGLVAIGINVES